LTTLDQKFSVQCEPIENSLKAKAEVKQVQKIRFALNVKADASEMDNILERLDKLKALESDRQTQRMNILLHGLKEDLSTPWETQEKMKEIIHKFMHEGLKIQDPVNIALVDYHRFPQHPVFK